MSASISTISLWSNSAFFALTPLAESQTMQYNAARGYNGRYDLISSYLLKGEQPHFGQAEDVKCFFDPECYELQLFNWEEMKARMTFSRSG